MFSSELKGQWVMINYWADWCPSCIKEMPELVAFDRANNDVQVFAGGLTFRFEAKLRKI